MMNSRSRLPTPSARRLVQAVAAAFSLFLLACQSGASAGGSVVGSKPAFRLKTTDGRSLGPGDFPGKVVLVDFWATWCGPCHLQAEIIEALQKDYKGKPLLILGANVGEPEETVRRFLVQAKSVSYPTMIDPKEEISGKLGINALPTLMVVDKQGKVIYFEAGITDATQLRQILRQAGV